MKEAVTRAIIEALEATGNGVAQYFSIQQRFKEVDVLQDLEFQRQFNTYYRVRRNPVWQQHYYTIMQEMRQKGPDILFAEVLDRIHYLTGRYEASFASKLVATIDPTKPVIDKHVLANLGLRLPGYAHRETRRDRIVEFYEQLNNSMRQILDSELGGFITNQFTKMHGDLSFTEIKMLDFVLWQSRGNALSTYLQDFDWK